MTRSLRRFGLVVLAGAFLQVVPLHGQGLSFLGGVFSNVTDINAGFVFGTVTGRAPVVGDTSGYGLRGLAFEVTFDLGMLLAANPTCKTPSQPITEIRVRHPTQSGGDSTVVRKPPPLKAIDDSTKAVCEPRGLWGELGFGYSQIGRFRQLGATVPVSGAIEELPFVSLYGSLDLGQQLVPYVGVRAGLVQLKDFRATVDGKGVKGVGSTFEYGLLVGAGLSVGEALLFGEMAWTQRTFDGIDWGSTATLPVELSQPIGMDTRTITVGMQLKFKK